MLFHFHKTRSLWSVYFPKRLYSGGCSYCPAICFRTESKGNSCYHHLFIYFLYCKKTQWVLNITKRKLCLKKMIWNWKNLFGYDQVIISQTIIAPKTEKWPSYNGVTTCWYPCGKKIKKQVITLPKKISIMSHCHLVGSGHCGIVSFPVEISLLGHWTAQFQN